MLLRTVFRNRYTLLLTVLLCYLLALVGEGVITGRDSSFVDFLEIENPLFDVIIPDLERLNQ